MRPESPTFAETCEMLVAARDELEPVQLMAVLVDGRDPRRDHDLFAAELFVDDGQPQLFQCWSDVRHPIQHICFKRRLSFDHRIEKVLHHLPIGKLCEQSPELVHELVDVLDDPLLGDETFLLQRIIEPRCTLLVRYAIDEHPETEQPRIRGVRLLIDAPDARYREKRFVAAQKFEISIPLFHIKQHVIDLPRVEEIHRGGAFRYMLDTIDDLACELLVDVERVAEELARHFKLRLVIAADTLVPVLKCLEHYSRWLARHRTTTLRAILIHTNDFLSMYVINVHIFEFEVEKIRPEHIG